MRFSTIVTTHDKSVTDVDQTLPADEMPLKARIRKLLRVMAAADPDLMAELMSENGEVVDAH